MGISKRDGKYWCDFCGLRILANPISEKKNAWTFCSLKHRNEKMTLIYGHENLSQTPNVTSIYHSFQNPPAKEPEVG